jgi:hypothetical protein
MTTMTTLPHNRDRDREQDFAGPFSPRSPLPAAVMQLPMPLPAPMPVPAPVRGPFLGLVSSVLSALVGGWLLLAPFAFDYRAGAHQLPQSALVDLSTGGAAATIGVLAALLFAGALAGRLRPVLPPVEAESEPEPTPEPEPAPAADPDVDLRDLLAPLVAALTADLRSRQDADR